MTDYINGTQPLLTTGKLIREIDKIELERSLVFDSDNIIPSQEKNYRKSVAEEIRLRCQMMEQQAPKIGRLLTEVKKTLQHGAFSQWVEENCPFSHRTALNLIALYNVTLDHPALITMKKSLLYHIGSKSFPEKLRQILADSVVGVYDFSKKEILQLQTKFINNELTEDSDELKSFLKKQRQVDLLKRWKLEWKATITTLEKQKTKYEKLLTRQKEVAGKKFINEYTEYWESSLRILTDAICQFSSLFNSQSNKQSVANAQVIDHIQSKEAYIEPEFRVKSLSVGSASLPLLGLSAEEVRKLDSAEVHLLKYYDAILSPDDILPRYNDDISDEELIAFYENEIIRELGPDDFIIPEEATPQSICSFSERQMALSAAGHEESGMKLLTASTVDNNSLEVTHSSTNHNFEKDGNGFGLSMKQLAAMKFEEPNYYIYPILRAQTLTMIYAHDGVGKTWFVHFLIARLTQKSTDETTIGPLKINKGCGVLLVDGELPLPEIKNRLQLLTKSMAGEGKDTPLNILSSVYSDAENGRFINLAEKYWRNRITQYFKENKDAELLVLDNLTSLISGTSENAKLGWEPINQWLLKLRAMGVATILVHHENKSGKDRGGSFRRDNLDTVIVLKHDKAEPADTVSIVVKFEKCRQLKSGEGSDIKLKLEGDDKTGLWFSQTN